MTTMPSGYSVADYGDMVDCEPRMSMYAAALKRSITPGCSVIDIGAGFGIFSLLACKYGAAKVIAIETNNSIELLHEMSKANGCYDKITVVRGNSMEFTPSFKANVIVSDCRGSSPLYENHIATIVDARERLLSKDGKLLPMRDTLKIALARSPRAYSSARRPWISNRYGLDLSAGHRFAANDYSQVNLGSRALVSDISDLAVIDYETITDPNIDSSVQLTMTKDGAAQGFLIWFDAEISEDCTYSNAPGQPPLVYGQMFLPFSEPIRLCQGQSVEARIRATLIDGQYTWSWDLDALDAKAGHKLRINQSSFLSRLYTSDDLHKRSDQYVPLATSNLQIARSCLNQVGEGKTAKEIARSLLEEYSNEFGSYRSALDYAVRTIERYQ